ncbi:MAG: nucleotide exchange factor GrpE [Patescibacteria group bacterium]|jgi:molecular chaperone GrpE
MFKKKNENKEIEELKKKSDEYLNGWKRAQADYQNLRKQTAKDQVDFVKFANENVILEIIPVLDNFQSAYNAVPKDLENNPWVQGIKFIKKQLEDVLAKNGVKQIECLNKEFDPKCHEAVNYKEEKDKEKKEKLVVCKEIFKGYELNGKIIRPAKVEVK